MISELETVVFKTLIEGNVQSLESIFTFFANTKINAAQFQMI